MRGAQRRTSLRHMNEPARLHRSRSAWWKQVTASKSFRVVIFLCGLVIVLGGIWFVIDRTPEIVRRMSSDTQNLKGRTTDTTSTGKIITTETVQTLTSAQTLALIKQTDPGYQGTPPPIQMQTFSYTMSDTQGKTATVFGRVFLPADGRSSNLPIFAFAPGTTGIDDQCAASLEKPAQRNWANYPSLMAAYAAQGYATVTTDYEGMRDATRLHHYMVGELEGRALLDSVRALQGLSISKGKVDTAEVYLSGYSQGGHAALWADRIASKYTPELTVKGVIGFGPLTDVTRTVSDISVGANLIWFAPYVLRSYADWYGDTYDIPRYLVEPFATNLNSDIARNCIDSNIKHWGDKDSKKVLTPQFLDALKTNTLASFSPDLYKRLQANSALGYNTASNKLLNQGKFDNVILPAQTEQARKSLCKDGNKVTAKVYPTATHYNTMVSSFQDTLTWMKSLRDGRTVPNNCSS